MKRALAEQRFHGEPGFLFSLYNNQFDEKTSVLAPLHHHPEFEFLMAKEGCLEVQIDDKEYRLKSGEGVFINSSCLHSIFSNDNNKSEFLAIVFAPEFLAGREEHIYQHYISPIMEHTLILPVILTSEMVQRMQTLTDVFFRHEFGYELTIKSELLTILSMLCMQADEPKTARPNTRSESIKHALTYIETHYMDEISLGELADISGLSREHFCRVFSELADMSPITYLNRYRIRQSMTYLKTTDKPISEISNLCGFGSCSYYNKMFRRFEGQTPKQYRNRHLI